MCYEGDSIKALKYLQVQLAQVVDHSNENESSEFYGLSKSLIHEDKGKIINIYLWILINDKNIKIANRLLNLNHILLDETRDIFHERTELYEKLLEFFSEEMKQPKGNLIDLIKIE